MLFRSGEHTASSAASAIGLYAVCAAIVEVDFGVDKLVAPENHRRVYDPGEEIFSAWQIARHPFLGGEVEWQASDTAWSVGDDYMFHGLVSMDFQN